MCCLHSLHVIETFQHSHILSKCVQFSLSAHDRTRQTHEHVAPILPILNLIRRTDEAEAWAGDLRLNSLVIEVLQRLIQCDVLPGLIF